jgi:hypothetical protein
MGESSDRATMAIYGCWVLPGNRAGDRLYTPWLKIIGKQAPDAPVVKVRLVHTGPALVAVKAQVRLRPCLTDLQCAFFSFLG